MSTETFQLERNQLIEDWAKFTDEKLLKSIAKHKIGYAGYLWASFGYHAKKTGNEVTSAQHTFDMSGRFIDMGVGRGQKIEDVKHNGEIFALVGGGRKPKKWFSPVYYRQVSALRSLLAKKYGEDFQDVIKENFKII